jgi:prevent-host-death family protein
MPLDSRRDPSEHLRLHWGVALADALHRRVHREVTRKDRVSAVLVPPDWYEAARRAKPAPEPQSWTSRTAREELTRVLDAVEYENAHVTITRYGRPAGLLVPPTWYRAALDVLAAPKNEKNASEDLLGGH